MASHDEDRYYLLYQWGLGARGGAVSGIHRISESSCCDDAPANCLLSEQEWLRVERALLEFKKVFPDFYDVVEARFVKGMYHEEIFLKFRIKRPQLVASLDGARMWVLSRFYQFSDAA